MTAEVEEIGLDAPEMGLPACPGSEGLTPEAAFLKATAAPLAAVGTR